MNGDMYLDDERSTRTVTVDVAVARALDLASQARGHGRLPASPAPVDEPTRRRKISAVLDLRNLPGIAARVSRRRNLDDRLARRPLVEIVLDDEQARTASSLRRS